MIVPFLKPESMKYMRREADILIAGGAWADDVNVKAVYSTHRLRCEADTAVNIVGADRGVMGF